MKCEDTQCEICGIWGEFISMYDYEYGLQIGDSFVINESVEINSGGIVRTLQLFVCYDCCILVDRFTEIFSKFFNEIQAERRRMEVKH